METPTAAATRAGAQPERGRPINPRLGLLLAAGAVACIAAASVFVRWAAPVSSIEIAFWRLLIAAVFVITLARARRVPLRYAPADRLALAGVGLVTALHFLAYIAAVVYTTIAHALALTYTAPLFVAALAAWRLRERPRRSQVVGMVIVIAGVAVLTGFEPRMDAQMALGDGLALLSAVTFGVYSVAGRLLQQRVALLAYTAAIYGSAALWLLIPAALVFDPSRYTLTNSLVLVALGLVPLGLGHTLYNAALAHTPAATVNTVATQEVTLGVLLAWALLGETPGPTVILGLAMTVGGLLLVVGSGMRRSVRWH
ncbi:MAG: DMT family transporter [Chloroflexi bacterium]|nr:DMT family transporter [Chloroflexota bacterium]